MVKNTFSQRLRGSSESSLPQDIIAIYLSDQRLQFVVANHLGHPHLLREYRDDSSRNGIDLLKAVFSEDSDIRKAYNNSYLVLKKPVALLEPLGLGSEKSDLTKYLISDSSMDNRLSDRIDSGGINVIYPFDVSDKTSVEQMLPNLTIYHHHTLFIQIFQRHIDNVVGDRIFIHLDEGSLSAFYYKNTKLQYSNQFSVQSDTDCIYYIMLIYQQFDLDPSIVRLSISLGVGSSPKLITQLRSYIQDIQLTEFQPKAVPSESLHQDASTYRDYYFALSAMDILTKK